ncbi:MAG: PAS domain S-box protein, partial [Verrucomicrobiae bacterium]|nr:PAS domain S-box protein [Verrucomicrobiae bacterium]
MAFALLAAKQIAFAHAAASEPYTNAPILVGVVVDNYPFSFRDKDGQVKGFAYDLVREIELVTGLRFKQVVGTTEEILELFEDGRIDLFPNLVHSPEREDFAEFSVPYITMTGQFFGHKRLGPIHSLTELKGRRLVVHRGSIGERLFKDAGLEANITYVESAERALAMINSGEADATFAARLTGLAIARYRNLKNIRPLNIKLRDYEMPCCIAVRKSKHDLLAQVNEGLAVLIRTGKIEELYQKWFGFVTPRQYTKEEVLGAVAVGLSIALGVTIWAIRRQYKLTLQLRRHAEALRQSEQKYRTLFETANDAIFLMREDRFVDCNARAAEMFGCPREKLIGARPFDFSPPTQPDGRPSEEKALEKIRAAYAQGPQFFEWEHCRPDGTKFIAEVSLNRTEIGPETLILAVVRDVTERKRAEAALAESEAKFRALTETTAAAIVAYQGNKFVFVNPAAERLTGYSKDEALNMDFWAIVHPDHRELVRQRGLARQRGEPVPDRYEFKIITKNGEERWIDFSAGRIMFGGQPAGLATALDITERKRAELALRESEERYRRLYESMMDAFVSTSMDGRIREFNSVYREMLGYAEDELRQLTYMDLTPARWHAFEARIVEEQILQRGYSDVYEKEYQKKDGTIFPVELRAFLIRDASGQPAGMWAIVRDITERKRAEAALRESEERFRLLAESSLVGIYLFQDNEFVYVNPALAAFFGYTPEEIIGKLSPLDLTHPDDRPMVVENIHRRIAEGLPSVRYEFRGLRKDGTVIYLESHGGRFQYRNRPAIMGTLVDITERKRAETALRRSQALLAEAQSIAHLGSWELDLTTNVLTWSDEVYRIFGLEPQEFGATYEAFLERVHPDDRAAVHAAYTSSVREGRSMYEIEHRIVRKDTGEIRHVHEKCTHVKDAFGRVVRSIGMVHDITERKQIEEQLRESERKYRELVEHANSIILRWTPDGRVTFLNEYGQRFFGYTQEEILGKHVVGTITPEIETGGRDLRTLMDKICANPTAFERNVNENMRRNGERVWIAWTNKVVTDKHGRIVEILSIGQDITDRLRAEEALHSLTARLHEVREEESRRIARELHDELGQVLTGLKMDLHWVERELEDIRPSKRTNAVLEKIVSASELVDAAIKTIQRICSELRPELLDKLGLAEALKFEARQFQERTRIKCGLQLPTGELDLPREIGIACY